MSVVTSGAKTRSLESNKSIKIVTNFNLGTIFLLRGMKSEEAISSLADSRLEKTF